MLTRAMVGGPGDTDTMALAGVVHQMGQHAPVSAGWSDRMAHAADASHFLLTPQLVVTPRDPAAVGALFRVTKDSGVHLTFPLGWHEPVGAGCDRRGAGGCTATFPEHRSPR